MPQITQLSYSSNGSVITKVRVVYPTSTSNPGYYVDLYVKGQSTSTSTGVNLSCRTYGEGWTKFITSGSSVPSTHTSLVLDFSSSGIRTTGDIINGSGISLDSVKSIGKYVYYNTNFTACPLTVSNTTKTCIGYFTFTKTGTFLLKICVRWTGSTTSSRYTIGVNNDNITVPQYDLSVYQDSNTQWGTGTSFVQQYLVFTQVTNTSTKVAIWVYHNKGSNITIDANWSCAMYIY